MAFTNAERTDIRRFCGYPAYGIGASGFQGWRFFQAYGVLEYRLSNLAVTEEEVARGYILQLAALENDIPATGSRLDTAEASVWTRNPQELRERTRLFDDWRRRLCGFLGVPPGPQLGDGQIAVVV